MPLLARVPPPPKGFAKDGRLVTLAQPTGAGAEAFRMLRTNLEFVALEDHDVRVVIVTSAIEEEGKSTTAANLAVAEARAGRRVCLVDLDLRRPYLDRFFSLLRVEGITMWLSVRSLSRRRFWIDLAPAVHLVDRAASLRGEWARRGRVAGRAVSGLVPPDPGEFVGTKRLAEILSLRAPHDFVIVDTPPLLRVGDAMTLSAFRRNPRVTRLNLVRRQCWPN